MDHCEPCGHRSPMIENQINFPSEWLLSKPKPQTAPGVAPVSNSCLCDWAGVTRRRLLKCARAFTYSETHTWFHECWLCLWRVNLFKTSLHTFFLSDVQLGATVQNALMQQLNNLDKDDISLPTLALWPSLYNDHKNKNKPRRTHHYCCPAIEYILFYYYYITKIFPLWDN